MSISLYHGNYRLAVVLSEVTMSVFLLSSLSFHYFLFDYVYALLIEGIS